MIEFQTGLLRAMSEMTPGELKSFRAHPFEPNPVVAPIGSNWFGRAASMAWNYNTVRLAGGLFIGEDVDFHGIVEQGYTPQDDQYLQRNDWIKEYYPRAWEDLLSSTSSVATERRIKKILEIHPSNMALAEGGIVGNILAAIPAAFFDPVNFIPIGGWALKGLGVSKVAATAVSTRIATNSLENLVITLAVEPLMRKHDLTRTEIDTLTDVLGSMILGGLIPAGVHLSKKGLRKAGRQAQRKLLGGQTADEFIEEVAGDITVRMHERRRIDPEADEVLTRIDEMTTLIPREDDIEKAVGYLREAFEDIRKGSSVIIGTEPDSFVGKYLTKWLVFNPTQRLLFNRNQGVRALGKSLLRTNLIGDLKSKNNRIAVEEIKEFVEQQWETELLRMRQIAQDYQSKNVEVTLDSKPSSSELFDLAGLLVISKQDKIDSVKNWLMPSRIAGEGDFDPFKIIRSDPTTKAVVERLAHEQKILDKSVGETMEMVGFSTREAYEIKTPGKTEQRGWLSRFMDQDLMAADEASGGYAMRDSIARGITETREENLTAFQYLLDKWAKTVEELEIQKIELQRTGKALESIDMRLATAREFYGASQKMVKKFEAENWDHEKILIAEQIIQNYKNVNYQGMGHRSGGGSASGLLARKVIIDDKYLSPWKHNNIMDINNRTVQHLIPRLILAGEMQAREDNFGLSKKISKSLGKLSKLREKLENADLDSLDNKSKKTLKNEWLNLVDDIIDLSEELEISNQTLLIDTNKNIRVRNPFDLDDPDSMFKSVEEIRDALHNSTIERSQIRNEVLHWTEKLDTANRQIEFIQGKYWNLFRKRQRIQHELLTGQEVVDDNNYYHILRHKKYAPVDSKGKRSNLKEFNKTETKAIEYEVRVTKKGSTYIHITDGPITGRAKLRMTSSASKPRGGETVGIVGGIGGKGMYIEINNRFLWVDPIELKTKQKAALDTASTQTGIAGDVSLKIGKKARAIEAQLKQLEEGDGFATRIKEEGVDRRAYLETQLDTTNKLIEIELTAAPKASPVIKLAREMSKSWEAVTRNQKAFDDMTVKMNQIARDVAGMTGAEHFSKVAKKHISKMTETDKASDFIGFSGNIRSVEAYGWWMNGLRRRAMGPSLEERTLGITDHISEYEYAVYRAERARRSSAYFFTDVSHATSAAARMHEAEGTPFENFKTVASDLDFVWNQLLNRNPSGHGSMDKAIRTLKNVNFLRYMGMVTIASMSDLGNAIGTLGMARYMRTMWHYLGRPDRKNLSQFATLNANFETASMLGGAQARAGALWGDASHTTDFYDSTTGQFVPQKGGGAVDWLNKTTGHNSKLLNVYNRLNMLNRWNAFNKRVVTLGVEDMVVDIGMRLNLGRAVSRRDLAITKSFGFTETDLKKIGKYWEKGGDSRTTIIGRDFYLAQSENWLDASFAFSYRAKIKGVANNIIVTPSLGSNPIWASHGGLSLLWQFKSFLSASFDMTFLPWLQRGVIYKDPNQIMQLVTTSLLGGMTYSIYELVKGHNPFQDKPVRDEDGKVVDSVHWSRTMFSQGLDRAGMFALLFEAQNIQEKMTGHGFHSLVSGDLDVRFRARSAVDLFGGPSIGFLDDLTKIMPWFGDPTKLPTRGQWGAVRRIIPLQNLIQARLVLDVVPSLIGASGEGEFLKPYPKSSKRSWINPNQKTSTHVFRTIQQRLAGE